MCQQQIPRRIHNQLPNPHILQATADAPAQMLLVYPEQTVQPQEPTGVSITKEAETVHTQETIHSGYSSATLNN